jgi:hypothetical protein
MSEGELRRWRRPQQARHQHFIVEGRLMPVYLGRPRHRMKHFAYTGPHRFRSHLSGGRTE